MAIPNGYNSIPDFQYFHSILAGAKTLGDVFYVQSTDGTDGAGYGSSPEAPVASIDYAVGLCTASAGDIIIVLPGHAETIVGTGVTCDVAGVTIVGLGTGSLRPQIKHNHADAEISIAADNVTWLGIRHSADVTGVKVAIEIEDGIDYCTVKDCVFDVVTTATDEFLVTIRTNDASNFALIEGNTIDMGLGGAVSAIGFTKDTDSTIVRGNYIQGDYSTANINGITTLSTKLLIEKNVLINGASLDLGTEPVIELITGSTGIVRDNDIVCNLATMAASVAADSVLMFRNYYNEDITGTGTIFGTASADG